MTFKSLWEKLHNMHPSKDIGLQIIDHLFTTEVLANEVRPQTIEFSYPPTGAELFEDLMTHSKFFNHLSGESHSKLNWTEFLKGWEAMRDNANPLMEPHTPLVAFDVVSHPGKGISRCIQSKPEILEREDVCMRVYKDGSPLLYSVITPAATITSPHCDNTGSGHIILLVYGVKLVLWWDSNSEMLEHFSHVHCRNKGQFSVNAVKAWPGLKWALLDEPGQYLTMDPGQVHLVLCPVNSAVSGWSFVISDWLENGKLRKMMGWEMALIEKRLGAPEIGSDSPFIAGGPVEVMSQDLDLWTRWLDSGVLSGELEKKLEGLRDEMKDRLEAIKQKKAPRQKSKGGKK